MNIYLLTQDENTGYNTYDACVVCAESEEDAKRISSYGKDIADKDEHYAWVASPEKVTATLIGKAANDIKQKVILGSFNAS